MAKQLLQSKPLNTAKRRKVLPQTMGKVESKGSDFISDRLVFVQIYYDEKL